MKFTKVLLLSAFMVLFAASSWAQAIFSTLTGIVSDPSQSVIAGAKVTLRDVQSGSERDTVTNQTGYFTFASVPVGSYVLTVEVQGFKAYKDDRIRLDGGEQRNVNVTMALGSPNETIEVTGAQNVAVPIDSGEKSFTLETKELQNFVQVGSDAAEYIKLVPGFGITNGTKNESSYNGTVIGINANGDGGSQSPLNDAYSYNGLPVGSLDIVSDGAHVSDPGCNCDTPVNPNSDFLQEFKVLTSNFSAENQKGPMLVTSVTKSGGRDYHGSAFFTARNYVLNANDWQSNNANQKQPANVYYYPGFTFGGPVRIPGTSFNKNRDKLFFFTGFEYYYQTLDTGLLEAVLPTANQMNGYFPELVTPGPTYSQNFVNAFGTSGQIPAADINPNMVALMKLLPSINHTPTAQVPYNYVQAEIFNQNDRQWVTRADYNISENTKVFVRYNYQREIQQFPVGFWWRNGNQVPYPSPVQGKNRSDSWTGTITHVFSPTMTNEVVMAYTFVGFPNTFENPAKVDRNNLGYNFPGLFKNGVTQIPTFTVQNEVNVWMPGGFEVGGASQGLFANKYMPSVSDTLTKVIGTHTIKAGFFYEWIRNAQPDANQTDGSLSFNASSGSNPYSYGSINYPGFGSAQDDYADMLTGNLQNYSETNFNRVNDISYNTYEGFLQDSWKATRRLTFEYGMRFTHFTPWVDDEEYGYSIFNQSAYSPSCASAPTYCGFEWHAKNPSVPLGGFPTRAMFFQPRFGAAYDLLGTGKTVLRGGWGRFYFHSAQFTNGLAASAGEASVSFTPQNVGAPLMFSNLSSIPFTASPAGPSAVNSTDGNQPYTDAYSFTISQQAPWSSLFEISYVGNRSNDLLSQGGYGVDINMVPQGAMFSVTDPVTGKPNTNPATANPSDWRPLQGYGDLNLVTNNLYSNYNGLQMAWMRRAGRYTIQANYTYAKALGIVNSSINPFNLRADYGVQPLDRRQLLNFAYSLELGSPVRGEKFLGGVVNGWQLSGITQLESGANLTYSGAYNSSTNFNMQANAVIPGSVSAQNPNGIAINNQSILGTNAIQLNPIVTCNPRSNLGPHQYVNGNCFALPTVVGQNGPSVLPAIYGPVYFDSDLGIFKNFQISESKKLQFRIQAANFLNHPLWSFPNSSNLTLQFNQASPTAPITQTNTNFGTATIKNGARIIELVVKFYF